MSTPISAFQIDGRLISPREKPYCIAEVGINHNGDMAIAKRMIDAAKTAGADAVKFQTFKSAEVCGDPLQTMTYTSQGKQVTEPMLDLFRRYEFSPAQWLELKEYCATVGITFFSTPQNPSDLALLLEIGVPALKVGSDDFNNIPLLTAYGKTGLPLILSCGMGDLADVHTALEAAGWFRGQQVALLLCTSQYPTPPQDVHASKLTTLQAAFPGLLVGLSDHTQGPLAAAVATALGARIFEKHFTLDHDMVGPDHWFSEDPQGLATWIATINETVTLCGSPYVRPTAAEMDMRILARRSVVALRDIEPGEVFDTENLGPRRPGGGLPPAMLEQVLGLTATRKVLRGERLALGDMSV